MDIPSLGLRNIGWLRNTNFLEFEIGSTFDVGEHVLFVLIVEGYTKALSSSSCSPTCSMDIRISFLWRRQLNYQISLRNVNSSGSDISSYQTHDLPLSKALKSNFSLLLWYITMQDLATLLYICIKKNVIGFFLRIAKDNAVLAHACIAHYHIGNNV